MGSGGSQVVGYRYYMGIHMGLCRGPIDEIIRVKVGDRQVWAGSSTGLGFNILSPNKFGGDKGEGGIEGPVRVMMGGPTQTADTNLAAMLGGTVPGYRGVCTLFYDGQISANNPYPKPWKFRIRRAVQGWDGDVWNSADAVISLASGTIKAMNPAHIIYEATTNRDWGLGKNASRIDLASFGAAADTLLAEGFGLCLRWQRQTTIREFISFICDHIGAAYYPDRETGQFKLVLFRDDYDPDTIPLYTYDTGLLGIDDDQNVAQGAAVNEVIVKWVDPITGDPRQTRAQNLAAIHAFGKISETSEYPGLPTAELAARIAQRDLRARSGFLKRFKMRFDRRATIEPGSVFRITDPTRGIANMIFRAVDLAEAGGTDGTLTVVAAQDVFGLGATAYVDEQTSGWTAPNLTPTAITTRRLIEVPYRDLARTLDPANLAVVADTAGALATLAVKPTSLSLSYAILTRVGGSGAFTDRGNGGFCPNGTLSGNLAIGGTSATINGGVDLELVEVGSAALIDDEILRIDTIDPATGAITFGRGCADTAPREHTAGTRVWFYEDAAGADPTEYTSGNTVYARLLTNTTEGQLAEGSAGTDNITMVQRQYRPYPPGNLTVNTEVYPASITGELALAWSHRDRLTQADQLVDTDEGSIGPEAGVTYTVRIYDGVTLKRTASGISGTTYTYASADETTDGGPFDPVRFTVHAVRGGLESAQGLEWEVERT